MEIILAPLMLMVLVASTGGANVQERSSKDCPVDLYVLIDFSASMKPHVKNLLDKCDEIATELRDWDLDWRFGLGGFDEKPVLPFSSK